MVSRVLSMENFTEENYVGLKEYVMDLKLLRLEKTSTESGTSDVLEG